VLIIYITLLKRSDDCDWLFSTKRWINYKIENQEKRKEEEVY